MSKSDRLIATISKGVVILPFSLLYFPSFSPVLVMSESSDDAYGHWVNCACGNMHPPIYPGRGTWRDPIVLDYEGEPPQCPGIARRLAEEERERTLKLIRRRIRMQQQARQAQGGGSESQGSTSGQW